MSAVRQTLAGIILILYFYMQYRYRPTRRELVQHLIMGFLIFTAANGLTTWAITYIPSGLGALIGCLFPFFLILLNYVLYKVPINLKSTVGLIIGFAGIGIIFHSYLIHLFQAHLLLGIFLCLLGVVAWTFGTLISSRQILKGNNMQGLGWQMLFGGVLLFISSFVKGEHVALDHINTYVLMLFFYLVLVGSVLCFLCFMYVMKNLPADISGIYAYINPIVALTLGILLLDEPFSWNLVLGTLITLSGIVVVKQYSR